MAPRLEALTKKGMTMALIIGTDFGEALDLTPCRVYRKSIPACSIGAAAQCNKVLAALDLSILSEDGSRTDEARRGDFRGKHEAKDECQAARPCAARRPHAC